MRWLLFGILVYICLVAQSTLGALLVIHSDSLGGIMPDLLAIVAVFFALSLRGPADVVIACWILGLGLDLSSAGGLGQPSAIGPMPLAYAAAGYMIYKVRDAFFREKLFSQVILVAVFCVMAHAIWITLQCMAPFSAGRWDVYGAKLLQSLLLAVYSAVLAPPLHALLLRWERVLIPATGGRGWRER